MTSRIRLRIESLISIDSILMPLLHSNLNRKSSLTVGFTIRSNENSEVAYFLGHPVAIPALFYYLFKHCTKGTQESNSV